MAKFNAKKEDNLTETYEGGKAYKKTTDMEWVNALLSSFLGDEFYEDAEGRQERFVELTREVIESYGCAFAAKAACASRNEFGMRSVSALLAAVLNDYAFENKRAFFRFYFKRPDDVAEVFAAVDALGSKPSHALVRGASDFLSGLSAYKLSKYKLKTRSVNMYDLVRLTHAHSNVIDSLMHDRLEPPRTWEVELTPCHTEEEKAAAWRRLVEEDKLGYMALLMNLRNILTYVDDKEWVDCVLAKSLMREPEAIRASGVFPFRVFSAYKSIEGTIPLSVMNALDYAFRASIGNMPELDGKNLLVLDVSGSMEDDFGGTSLSIVDVCACYCAAMLLQNKDAELMKFGEKAKYAKVWRASNVFSLIKDIGENDGCGYSTNIVKAYEAMHDRYDRIFLFSDMQVMSDRDAFFWMPERTAMSALKEYRDRFDAQGCRIYSFDCGNYHTAVENPLSGKLVQFTALNDKAFKLIEVLDGGGSVIDYLDKYDIS